jgi:hypothetical protein
MSDEEWSNVIKFRAELERNLGRMVTIGESLAISAKLNLLYISFGKETQFKFSGKGSELENLSLELGGETLKLFLEEMKRVFGIAEKESKVLSEYKEVATQK